MARRYQALWNRIKLVRSVTIKCKPAKMQTIVQAVKKEKSRENVGRKNLDLPHYGELSFTKDASKGEVTFKLALTTKAYDL